MITRESILEEAKKLGISLTEEHITKFITDQKLPDEDFRAELKKAEILEKVKDPAKALEMVNDLYAETKKRKDKIKELQTELDAIKLKQQQDADDKLKADGKIQELLDQKIKELETVKGYKEKYDGLSTKVRENTLAKIKPEYAEFAKSLSDEQLAILPASHFLEAGQQPHNGHTHTGSPIKLTDAQEKEMKEMGIEDAKDYLEVIEVKNKTKKETT